MKKKSKSRMVKTEIAGSWSNSLMQQNLLTYRKNRLPKTIKEQVERAQNYREGIGIVQQIIDIKQNFGSAGFKTTHTNTKIKNYYDKVNKEIDMDTLVLDMWDDLLTSSNVIFHWKIDDVGEIEYAMCLDPALVDVVSSGGRDLIYITPDDEFKNLVRKPKKTSAENEYLANFDKRWIDAATNSFGKTGGKVLLSENYNEHAIIIRLGKRKGIGGLAQPKMKAVFDDVELRELMISGDWEIAFQTKNMITHITAGESIDSGEKAGTRKNWATRKELDALKSLMKHPAKALSFYSNHTVKINFLIPPQEVFDARKYIGVENRIYKWAGIGLGIVVGEGGNYATAYINIKKLIAELQSIRRIIRRLLEKFYEHPSISPNFIKKNEEVLKIRWDEQSLKEPRHLLEEVRFAVQQGFASNETASDIMGYDSPTEKERKTKEWEERGIWFPSFEPRQGLLSGLPVEGLPEGVEDKRIKNAKKGKEEKKPGRPNGGEPSGKVGEPNGPQPRPSTSIASIESLINEGMLNYDNIDLAPYTAKKFHHVPNPKYSESDFKGKIVGSKKLKNGVVLRFAILKETNKSAVMVYLVPKTVAKTYALALKWVKGHS